jgi:hypothetical protein
MKPLHRPVFQIIGNRHFYGIILALLSLALSLGVSHAGGIPYDPSGIYEATTDDHVTIKLYRYRPDTTEPFRTRGTPVLLMPGILQNIAQYLACSPDEVKGSYAGTVLPEIIPDWAMEKDVNGRPVYKNGIPVLEKHIRKDPMRIWSIAHYLWIRGYDPWFANYRGTGRGDMHSGGDASHATIDTWGALDTAAAIDKVWSLTGKSLYIGGHSTGSYVCYIYLQGCTIDHFGWRNKALAYSVASRLGYQPHVRGNSSLAAERNARVRGWIAIDPAGTPPLPSMLDAPFWWSLVGSELYLPMDAIGENLLGPSVNVNTLSSMTTTMFGYVYTMDTRLSDKGERNNFFSYLNFWYPDNMDSCMGDLTARYALSGTCIRTLGPFMDNGLNIVNREFWKNGYENRNLKKAPTPAPGHDGYYYYSEHMNLVTVPMIACLSDSGALVDPNLAYEFIISRKTHHPLDESHVIPHTGHFDVAAGKKSPNDVFPRIGAWLDRVEATYR